MILTPTSVCCESSTESCDEDCEENVIKLKGHYKTAIEELQIKSEVVITEIKENIDQENWASNDNVVEEKESAKEYVSTATSTKDKTKEPKNKKRKLKNESPVTDETEKCDDNEFPDDVNDNDFMESSEENVPIEMRTQKRKTRKKEPKTTKRKIKTVVSEDNLSDNEPLSKCATKTTDKIIKEPLNKKNGLNIEFFDDYATVTFLTPDDAKKELLSRKDSSNYKRSPFKCDFCYKGYEAKAAFENHMKKHSKVSIIFILFNIGYYLSPNFIQIMSV